MPVSRWREYRRRFLAPVACVLGLAVGAGLGAGAGEPAKTVTDAGLRAETVTVTGPTRTVHTFVVHNHVVLRARVHTRTVTVPAPMSAEYEAAAGEGGGDEVGSSSHASEEEFCEEHICTGDFEGEDGTIVECVDGSYSHAGGKSDACSDHGGEA